MNRSLIVFMNISNTVKYPARLVGLIPRLLYHILLFAIFFYLTNFFIAGRPAYQLYNETPVSLKPGLFHLVNYQASGSHSC